MIRAIGESGIRAIEDVPLVEPLTWKHTSQEANKHVLFSPVGN